MCNQFRVEIHLLMVSLVHVVVAHQHHLLVTKPLLTKVLASTSLMFGLGSVHSPMISRPFQMSTFSHMIGLETIQLQCHHLNISIRIQLVAMTFMTTAETVGDPLTLSQQW